MKVRETKEVLATISSACTSRHDWHGGTPGSSKFSEAHTRLGSVRPRRQKPFRHKYFHGYFAWSPHESWPCTQSGKVRIFRRMVVLMSGAPGTSRASWSSTNSTDSSSF